MPIEKLDFYFPFLVFFYGFLLVLMFENAALLDKLAQRYPQAVNWLAPRKKFAWICLFVGGLWTLQNTWL